MDNGSKLQATKLLLGDAIELKAESIKYDSRVFLSLFQTPYSLLSSSLLIANSCAIHNGEFNILTVKKNSVSIEVTLIPLTDQANKSK